MPKTFKVFVKNQNEPIHVQADSFEIQGLPPGFPNSGLPDEPIRFIDNSGVFPNATIPLDEIQGHEHFTRNNLQAIAIEENHVANLKTFKVRITNKPDFLVQAKECKIITDGLRTNVSGSVMCNPKNRLWIDSHALVALTQQEQFAGNFNLTQPIEKKDDSQY